VLDGIDQERMLEEPSKQNTLGLFAQDTLDRMCDGAKRKKSQTQMSVYTPVVSMMGFIVTNCNLDQRRTTFYFERSVVISFL